MPQGVLLATLALNEMEWLPRLYEQHKDWPELRKWAFVEAADRSYAGANPDMVSEAGLSVDGTTEFLEGLAARDARVVHVRYGWADHPDPALRKIGPRNVYWVLSQEVKPEFVVQIDADEFYTKRDQGAVNKLMRRRDQATFDCWTLPRRELWRPPRYAAQSLFSYEAVGGFWSMPCCHWFRWSPGTGHRDCHITPQRADGTYLNDRINTLHDRATLPPDNPKSPEFVLPQMVHLGYAASERTRLAKNKYYEERGEAVDVKRQWYVNNRRAWMRWRLKYLELPDGGKVIPYTGPVPECFLEEDK